MGGATEQQEKLEAELRAIELWDALYHEAAVHSETEELSYQIRQERRKEIMRKIQAFDGHSLIGSFFSQDRELD